MREKIDNGELMLMAHFDNEKYATCSTGKLEIHVPEGANVLEYIVIQSRISFKTTWELSDDEIKSIEKASDDRLGDIGRDEVAAVLRGKGVPEIKDVKSVYTEVGIAETQRRVDAVVETEDGRFIVIEIETTRNPNAISNRFWKGVAQLKEYRELIEKYGLDLGGEEPVKSIDEYWVFVIYFDFENKVTKAFYDCLQSLN
ncbi:MAG: hypothetical protein QXZ66_07335 [Thermoproteota archaeon]